MAVTDLLIEAEHGPDSSAYLVTTDAKLASKALDLIPRMVAALPEERASFCSEVFRTNGGVILASEMDDAVDFINQFAPEHLQILTREPSAVSGKCKIRGRSTSRAVYARDAGQLLHRSECNFTDIRLCENSIGIVREGLHSPHVVLDCNGGRLCRFGSQDSDFGSI